MEAFGVMRIDGKDFPVQVLRLIEPPGTVMDDRLIEERLQRQTRAAVFAALKFLLSAPVGSAHDSPCDTAERLEQMIRLGWFEKGCQYKRDSHYMVVVKFISLHRPP
jgi:hypothetical protein